LIPPEWRERQAEAKFCWPISSAGQCWRITALGVVENEDETCERVIDNPTARGLEVADDLGECHHTRAFGDKSV